MNANLPSKPCLVCGRTIVWRRKWARDWEQVRYCSDRCRRQGRRPLDDQLEQAVLALLADRPTRASICPSEAARRVDPQGWRALMEPARQAARRLRHQGVIEILQAGQVVDPDVARGPIRLRLATRI